MSMISFLQNAVFAELVVLLVVNLILWGLVFLPIRVIFVDRLHGLGLALPGFILIKRGV